MAHEDSAEETLEAVLIRRRPQMTARVDHGRRQRRRRAPRVERRKRRMPRGKRGRDAFVFSLLLSFVSAA